MPLLFYHDKRAMGPWGPWIALGSPVTGNVPSRGIRDPDHIGLAKASSVRIAAPIQENGDLLNDLTREMPNMLADTMGDHYRVVRQFGIVKFISSSSIW